MCDDDHICTAHGLTEWWDDCSEADQGPVDVPSLLQSVPLSSSGTSTFTAHAHTTRNDEWGVYTTTTADQHDTTIMQPDQHITLSLCQQLLTTDTTMTYARVYTHHNPIIHKHKYILLMHCAPIKHQIATSISPKVVIVTLHCWHALITLKCLSLRHMFMQAHTHSHTPKYCTHHRSMHTHTCTGTHYHI